MPIATQTYLVVLLGIIAPNEKCQVDNSMMAEPLKQVNNPKRMLASSRHLSRGQRKSTQLSKKGCLLSLPPSSVL